MQRRELGLVWATAALVVASSSTAGAQQPNAPPPLPPAASTPAPEPAAPEAPAPASQPAAGSGTAPAPSAAAPAPSAAAPSPAFPPPHVGMPWMPPQPAPAQAAPEQDKPSGPTRDRSRDFWQVELGMRSMWIRGAGYDPFSTNNNLSEASIGGTRALVLLGPVSIAAGLTYESGSKDAQARGAAAKLSVHRAGAVGEARLHVGRDVYGFFKLVPQAVYTRASLQDDSVAAELVQKKWRFGADTTIGCGWNAPRTLGAPHTTPEVWLTGELGYGWTMTEDVKMSPDVGESDPSHTIVVNTGPLALRGVMMRLGAAITF